MAYTPTVWATGDVITAEKLNKAEQGIVGADPVVLSITIDNEDTLHLGKSWDDLMALSDIPVFAHYDISETVHNRYILVRLYEDTGAYYAVFNGADTLSFSSDTASTELVVVD